jgi:hypothetical protein
MSLGMEANRSDALTFRNVGFGGGTSRPKLYFRDMQPAGAETLPMPFVDG